MTTTRFDGQAPTTRTLTQIVGLQQKFESVDLYSGHGGKASFTVPNDCRANNCKIHLHYAAACPTR